MRLPPGEEAPLAGSRPGTERWIVWLRDRGYDLEAHLRAARRGADPSFRQQALTSLQQAVANDQATVVQAITQNGGIVENQFWVLSALAVELPAASVAAIRSHPRVRRMVPVRTRADASIVLPSMLSMTSPPMPQGTAMDDFNHCVPTARGIITSASAAYPGSIPANAHLGLGVRVAVLDSGLDQDGGGVTGAAGPHDAFRDPNNLTQSRVDVHLRAGPSFAGYSASPVLAGLGIDCNNIAAVAPGGINGPSIAYRACTHSTSAFHGTSMASIIAGRAHGGTTNGTAWSHSDGHAPMARLVDVSVTVVPPNLPPPPPFPPPLTPLTDRSRWTTNTATTLNAIQLLQSWMIQNNAKVHVLNYSFAGVADPEDPENVALDEFAVAEDVLLVAAANNTPDDTRFSAGFYNGLAVGAVHARLSENDDFISTGYTARGPLASDTRRFYPDVCAVGSGGGGANPRYRYALDETVSPNSASYLSLPRIDSRDACSMRRADCGMLQGVPTTYGNSCLTTVNNDCFGLPVPANVNLAQGTSEACAQVAGVASLYRAVKPTATALETRAALLLNVVGAYPGAFGGPPPIGTGNEQDTYANRNTFGVGFVRADLVAQFGVGDAQIAPTSKEGVLDGPGATYLVPLSALTPGERYVAVACWPCRWTVEQGLVDVDMEVVDPSQPTTVFARSRSRGNSYERVGFVAPATGNVEVVLSLAEGSKTPQMLPVHFAFRHFSPDLEPGVTGTDFAPTHAITGFVESRPAAALPGGCVGTAPAPALVGVAPSVYSSSWGSGPMALEPVPAAATVQALPASHRGFDLTPPEIRTAAGPTGFNIHVELHPSVVSNGPLTVGGLRFRLWRPFRCSGPVTFDRISAFQTAAPSAVTGSPPNPTVPSLWMTAPSGAIQVRLSSFVVPPPPTAAANVVDTVSPTFDIWFVEVPFEQPFTVNTPGALGNLHLWFKVSGTIDFEVDFAGDTGDPRYGLQVGSTAPGALQADFVGWCPIIGLLGTASPQSVLPVLTAFGEPMVGRSLALVASRVPPASPVSLFWSEWAPDSLSLGNCQVHVAYPPIQTYSTTVDSSGRASWAFAVPLTGILLGKVYGFQVLVGSNVTTTNALRVGVGGGL